MAKEIYIPINGKGRQSLACRDQERPIPKRDQVLISSEGFGINFADVMARQGLYKEAPKPPFVPGYEVVGRVEEVGDAEGDSLVGKRVLAFTKFGAYAEWALADRRSLVEIDEAMDPGQACALATQYCTAYYMLYYHSKPRAGQWALIHSAAGGVGTALTQLCRLEGVKVVGLCSNDQKMDLLKRQGVDLAINYKDRKYWEVIKEALGERPFHFIFNATMGSTFKRDLRMLGPGGMVFIFGGAQRNLQAPHILNDLKFLVATGFLSPLFLMMKAQGIVGVNMLRVAENDISILGECMGNLLKLYKAGKIRPLVDRSFCADDVGQAMDWVASGKSVGKVYVYWKK